MTTAPPSDRSAGADGPVDAQLDRAAFAKMAGYSAPGTITSMLMRAQKQRRKLEERVAAGGTVRPEEWAALFPEPDDHIGRTPFWYASTVCRWMEVRRPRGSSPTPEGAEGEAGPGECPICHTYCKGSVAAHRMRRDQCSYDPRIREAAAKNSDQWDEEKVAQSGPGTCPICREHFDGSVTAHRMQKRECSFDPQIRAAARA